MATLSSNEKDFLDSLAEYNAEHSAFSSNGVTNMALVLLGEKPAGSMNLSRNLSRVANASAEEQNNGLNEELANILEAGPLEYTRVKEKIVFALSEDEFLDCIDDWEDGSIDHNLLGTIFGYPDSAREAFGTANADDLEDFIETNTPWSFEAYCRSVEFSFYFPNLTMGDIQTIIETSTHRSRLLRELLADCNSYPYLEQSLENEFELYEPLTNPSPSEFFDE